MSILLKLSILGVFYHKGVDMNVKLLPATLADYQIIQNLASYYGYDRTGYMGWSCPENGIFECIDFKHYFENPKEN